MTALPLLPHWGMAATVPRRLPSPPNSKSIHSGHSLTDAYIHTGSWPGHLRRVAEDAGIGDVYHKLTRSTIPGSPMEWRWRHPVDDHRPGDAIADARRDIAGFDTLVITEGGPPPAPGPPREPRGVAPQRRPPLPLRRQCPGERRGARDIALWSIWPAHTLWRPDPPPETAAWQDLPDLGAVFDGYGESFAYLADHASHVLRQAYPDLPPDWRIWVFPGHLFIKRLWRDSEAGLVPGISRFSELFEDSIHPTSHCGFGLACLMVTCLYQIDLSRRKLRIFDGISPELRDYFAEISWQIATAYAPAGLGGEEAAAPVWVAGRDEDLLPGWTL